MNKKVMALAVAGALAAPAAALAQVQIGGGIHLQYFMHDPDNDSSSSSTDVLTTSEPELYFRGEEKLGGGNSVWFQCTSSFDVLGQGLGSWCGRNSAIGWRGDFGNVFAGTWDTPHKLVTNLARGWWGGTNTLQGGSMVILANGSDSNVGNATGAVSFFRRHRRSINYHSPNWSGFSLQGAVSAGNEATNQPDAGGLSQRMFSIAGQYRSGPLFAGVGYETHEDFNPFAGVFSTTAAYTGGSDTSYNIVVGYTFFNQLRLSAMWLAAEYEAGGPTVTKVEHDGFVIYGDWSLGGPHSLYFQYADRGDTDIGGTTVNSSGAQVIGVAYGYRLSKRTQLYAAFNQMKNDTNANFNFGTTGTTDGGKQKAIGVGLRHSF